MLLGRFSPAEAGRRVAGDGGARARDRTATGAPRAPSTARPGIPPRPHGRSGGCTPPRGRDVAPAGRADRAVCAAGTTRGLARSRGCRCGADGSPDPVLAAVGLLFGRGLDPQRAREAGDRKGGGPGDVGVSPGSRKRDANLFAATAGRRAPAPRPRVFRAWGRETFERIAARLKPTGDSDGDPVRRHRPGRCWPSRPPTARMRRTCVTRERGVVASPGTASSRGGG